MQLKGLGGHAAGDHGKPREATTRDHVRPRETLEATGCHGWTQEATEPPLEATGAPLEATEASSRTQMLAAFATVEYKSCIDILAFGTSVGTLLIPKVTFRGQLHGSHVFALFCNVL